VAPLTDDPHRRRYTDRVLTRLAIITDVHALRDALAQIDRLVIGSLQYTE
jgi:DNA-binding transcriptional MerR regulator